MTTESIKVLIKSLNGTNYATWKIQCRMALIKDGLWGIVNDTKDTPTDERKSQNLCCVETVLWQRLFCRWSQPCLLWPNPNPEDPTEVWKKLADHFQKKTWSNKLTLRRKLYDLKLKDGQPVQKHVKALTEIFDEIAFIGDPLDDESKVVHLLASLPDAFDILVTALETSAEVPQLEVVTERLLYYEDKDSSNTYAKHIRKSHVNVTSKSENGTQMSSLWKDWSHQTKLLGINEKTLVEW